MAIDALSSVPLGRSDTGEAVVLGKGNFEDFTSNILKLRQKEGEERKQTNAEIGKLLQDQVQSKWAKDNIDIFQPRMQAIKDKTLELYKEKKGRLNSVDLYGIQSEWNKLKAEADASNSLYAEEQNRIKALEEDPTGLKYDAVESQKLRDLYRDPMSDPELAKEVNEQFGGSVIKWRANNERKYANVGAYSIAKDIDEYAKDKLSTSYTKLDKSGKPIFEEDQFGILSTPIVRGVNKEKARTSYNAFYDRTDYKGGKFREEVGKMVGKNFDIDENGTITPNNSEVATVNAFKSALEKINPSMSPAQKAEVLRKEYGLELIKAQYPDETKFEYQKREKANNININNGGGGGPSTKFNWAAGATDEKQPVSLEWAKVLPGRKAVEGAVNYVNRLWEQKVPYVTAFPSSGTTQPEFELTNKTTKKPMAVTTLGFKKLKNGDWVYIASEKQKLSDGATSDEDKKLEAEKKFEPIEVNLSVNTTLAAELAAAYGLGSTEGLKKHLEEMAKKSGVKQKGVTVNENATPSPTGTPTSNKSTEKVIILKGRVR